MSTLWDGRTIQYIGPKPILPHHGKSIPKDYPEFAAQYYSLIKKQVAKFPGIPFDEREDVTQHVIMQFIEGDYLNIYNPEKQTIAANHRYAAQLARYHQGLMEHPPDKFLGKFSSFVYEFTKRRLKGIRDRTVRRTSIMRSLDSYYEADSGSEEEVNTMLGVGVSDPTFINLEVREALQQTWAFLNERTVRTPTRDFPALFNALYEAAFEEDGTLNRDEYAASRRITISAVSMQVRQLRQYLEQNGLFVSMRKLNYARNKQSACDGKQAGSGLNQS